MIISAVLEDCLVRFSPLVRKKKKKSPKACTETCQSDEAQTPSSSIFFKSDPTVYLSLSLWCIQHSSFLFNISFLLSDFLCLKPLMLSVVNGLASCFKAAIAECKFWLLRFIYTGILKLIVYISSHLGMTQCKQK